LTTCPDCGRAVSPTAPICPNCGKRLRSSIMRKGATCGCVALLVPIVLLVGFWLIGYLV